MAQRLFLLDGMALVYRAHFAFATRPIRTSSGQNTSALFGFISTLLDILQTENPTHLAVAFDTSAPTARHRAYPEYKAQREAMPEELSAALPHVRRILDAFRVPALSLDGYEADDIIGTLVRRAEPAGFECFMVTPDKDFGQLVTEHTRLWRPGRQGSDHEVLGVAEICARWGIRRVDQVIDMLGLMGDASDNIPGVPGVGEKTAAKLLTQFDSLENLLAQVEKVPGKLGESLRANVELARLSRQLAVIDTQVPVDLRIDDLVCRPRDDDALRALCIEFEFNSLGRRLFGDDFKAGRGADRRAADAKPRRPEAPAAGQGDLFAAATPAVPERTLTESPTAPKEEPAFSAPAPAPANLKTIRDVAHHYEIARTSEDRRRLVEALRSRPAFCFDTETEGLDAKTSRLVGIAFSDAGGRGWYVPVNDAQPGRDHPDLPPSLQDLAPLFTKDGPLKVGHNLKFDLLVLRWHGLEVQGPFFDTMIAHTLVEPELRHGMDYLSEALLGYTPIPIESLIGPKGAAQKTMAQVEVALVAEYAAEDADVTWQLYEKLRASLVERGLEKVFYEVEMTALPALVAMEYEGIRIDVGALAEFSAELAREMTAAEADIHRLAGHPFNVNSNRQLGDVLFNELRLVEKPRKTPTGQYATDEQTLQSLAGEHAIVRRLLDFRTVSKLKSTYADALPETVFAGTRRVHTTYHQAATATGRLSSVDPNLQNIPIRTERGQEIRRAFVARDGWKLLSADYSQIELRIIAALSREETMIEAFRRGEDIHASTAARVFSVSHGAVTAEMRRRAKMVNFGIAYGISAFGLAQRLGIPRSEAAQIIDHYFASFPGIRRYMEETIAGARQRGYVETVTGRRRYLRDINSANATVRGAAERNAINTPIQGSAADMIKIAMGRIQREFTQHRVRSRLLLQVHDELVFDLCPEEEREVRTLVVEAMQSALPLPGNVPILVETGTGTTWLEAH
ncbi:MAG: DNA polymerase I [Verrucomicrobiales bacterium]|nr:DNA polymerase I [Verrucomicrobiales bacterium]